MKWLEEIHIRVYEVTREELMETLWLTLESHDPVEGPETARMYFHSKYDSDLCLHLHWSDRQPARGSVLAQQILAGLKSLASVKHTVWTESKVFKQYKYKGGSNETE